jgi:hypothetical protein
MGPAPDQYDINGDKHQASDIAQLLSDNGKKKVILRLRQIMRLLDALAETDAESPPDPSACKDWITWYPLPSGS